MESGGFSHGAAFHPVFLPKLPSYKQTPWTAPPAHNSSLTRRGVALCCVAFPPAANFLNAHLEGITGAFMGGEVFELLVRSPPATQKKKKKLRLRMTQCFCITPSLYICRSLIPSDSRSLLHLDPSVCANTVCPPPSSPDMKRFFQRLAPLYKPCGFEGKHSTPDTPKTPNSLAFPRVSPTGLNLLHVVFPFITQKASQQPQGKRVDLLHSAAWQRERLCL